ncbi:MAG: hypothetical protein FD180_4171 [Planctomycetota bacterium]|nr:MAG: hypothetical protein FD180_4171 [Planctomycetota bacterium]
MRRATLAFAISVLALSAFADDGAWNIDPEAAAKKWFEGELKALKKADLTIDYFSPVELRGSGAPALHARLRFFEARATLSAKDRFDWHAGRIAVKRNGSAWKWTGSLDDLRVVLDACGIKGTDEKGMRAVAAALVALPDGPGYEDRRAEVSGRTLTYREHRATGFFSCGFAGNWHGEQVFTFDERGGLADLKIGVEDMSFESYLARRKSGDPLFVDEVNGGEEMVRMIEGQEQRVADLVAAFVGDDEAKALDAERQLWRSGGKIEPLLEKSFEGGSPAVKERISRLRRWLAPAWAEDADESARTAYEKQLPAEQDAWGVLKFDRIELTGAGEPLSWGYRLFRAECRSKSGVQAKHDLVLCAKDGSLLIWTGEAAQCREILQRCGLVFEGGDFTKKYIGALAALPLRAYDGRKLRFVDPERIEVKGREVIWHEHRMWFGSGVLGGYTEDVIYVFGENGLLDEIKTTGIPNLTKREMDRILGEAEPWLHLEGWVADETRDALQKAQAGKEKSPPRHGEGK